MASNDKPANTGLIGGETTIELIAGQHPNGELIIERVLVSPQSEDNSYLLLKSPLFVRGIARADVVQQLPQPKGAFKILRHGGNLCIRIFSKEGFTSAKHIALEQALTADIEKLGGDLDIREAMALVYSIHVSCGFSEIEKLLNDKTANEEGVVWYYGNVYDPETGEPLDWWQSILSPE